MQDGEVVTRQTGSPLSLKRTMLRSKGSEGAFKRSRSLMRGRAQQRDRRAAAPSTGEPFVVSCWRTSRLGAARTAATNDEQSRRRRRRRRPARPRWQPLHALETQHPRPRSSGGVRRGGGKGGREGGKQWHGACAGLNGAEGVRRALDEDEVAERAARRNREGR